MTNVHLLVGVQEFIEGVHQNFLSETKLVQPDAKFTVVHELGVVALVAEDRNTDWKTARRFYISDEMLVRVLHIDGAVSRSTLRTISILRICVVFWCNKKLLNKV